MMLLSWDGLHWVFPLVFISMLATLSNLFPIFRQVCFPNKTELKAAVDVYIEQNCATNTINSGCSIGGRSIAETYGWPIGTWCVSQVTDMSELFKGKTTFNEDISGWNTSRVKNMNFMFYGTPAFNQDISNWNVSSVTSMYAMFSYSTFDGDISLWDTSSVSNMGYMFRLQFQNWLTDMGAMFKDHTFWGPGANSAVKRVARI